MKFQLQVFNFDLYPCLADAFTRPRLALLSVESSEPVNGVVSGTTISQAGYAVLICANLPYRADSLDLARKNTVRSL